MYYLQSYNYIGVCYNNYIHSHIYIFIIDAPRLLSCLRFDDGWNNYQGIGGIGYFTAVNMERVVDDPARGHSGKFNGTSHIEFPLLNNNYAKPKLAISFWYKHDENVLVSKHYPI